MMGNPRTPIAAAMMALKEYRDNGILVHEVLADVADEWGVPVQLLRHTAEESWGAPLETDHARHAAHFDFVSDATAIEKQARDLAKAVYEANLPGIKDFSFWKINWDREINQALMSASLDHPALEQTAREAFLDESRRLEKSIKMVRAKNA